MHNCDNLKAQVRQTGHLNHTQERELERTCPVPSLGTKRRGALVLLLFQIFRSCETDPKINPTSSTPVKNIQHQRKYLD